MKSIRRQRGVTTVETAIAVGVFLMLFFSVIEMGRMVYTWNAMVEATRRAARVAVVCPVDDPSIVRVGAFANASSAGSPSVSGLKPENLTVSYLDGDGASTTDNAAMRFVRVEITGFKHQLRIPFIEQALTAPRFATTLPRESLGIPRFEDEPIGCAYP